LLRTFALSILVLLASSVLGAPRLLIAQLPIAYKGSDDPNRPIANLMAAEFDQNGKVQAIVYGLSDPIFRQAATSGKLGNPPEVPTTTSIMAVAGPLDAEYVAVVSCVNDKGRYVAKLELLRGGKSIWKDDQNMAASTSTALNNDAVRSLARTLVTRMSAEPLKGLSAPVVTTPAPPDPGQAPPTVSVAVTPPPVAKDNTELIKSAAQLSDGGKAMQAIQILRDGVDVSPLDPALRLALVRTLAEVDPLLAASEAHNAGLLMPEVAELRTLAARAWLKAGQPENAQVELNEAIARDPDAVPTRLLMAEIAIAQLKPELALQHVDFALGKQPTPEGFFLRALCYAVAGKTPEMKGDMAKAGGNLQEHYDFATEVLDRGMQLDATQVRALMQRVVVKPDERTSVELVGRLQQSYQTRAEFCELMQIPEPFRAAHNQRLLAYRLMAQTLSDLQSFMAGGGDAALSDARIDLAEALRNGSECKVAEAQIRKPE
jgi:tetratricopeptide (TPR) repeat protein